jgi:hypothetical protein
MTHRSNGRTLLPTCLDDLAGHVPQSHIDGAKAASEAFREAGVRHVLVGGLAVGIHGYPRHTKDIDFMVGDEAFEFHGLLVEPKPGLPMRYAGVTIDWVSLEPNERSALEEFLVKASPGEVPVMGIVPLIAMKLIAARHKDKTDIVELIKAGADIDPIIAFVGECFPTKLPLLRQLIGEALDEE